MLHFSPQFLQSTNDGISVQAGLDGSDIVGLWRHTPWSLDLLIFRPDGEMPVAVAAKEPDRSTIERDQSLFHAIALGDQTAFPPNQHELPRHHDK